MDAKWITSLTLQPYARDASLIAAAHRHLRPSHEVYAHPGVAVVLGRGSRPARELLIPNILADGTPVMQRAGGGCAVVLDPGNVIVSVAWPLPGIGEIRTAFRRISDWVIAGLDAIGVTGVKQRGVSDLALGDRKIGGACIYRTRGMLYYSTTLLVAPDLNLVSRYLQHPPREPAYRRGRSHCDFMGKLGTALENTGPAAVTAKLKAALEIRDLACDFIPQRDAKAARHLLPGSGE